MADFEKIIVSLTSWPPRFNNLPTVLDSILGQTIRPDAIVLNISEEDDIPSNINEYIINNKIEVHYVPNTKVYKKLIPTLLLYPDDCVISIDDDWVYPSNMIEDFVSIHEKYPDFPISGNREVWFGMQCHCGCASLTKYEYLANYINCIDSDLISNCPSDDLVYTFFSNLSGHPYIQTNNIFYTNMDPLGGKCSYSESFSGKEVEDTYLYLLNRFGDRFSRFSNYPIENYFARLFDSILDNYAINQKKIAYKEVRSSASFRLGNFLLHPLSLIKQAFHSRGIFLK